MLTGKQYLESIRDGRKVYIGKKLVEDVTAHPAFANRSIYLRNDRELLCYSLAA